MSALLPGGVVHSVRFDRACWSERAARQYLADRGVVPVGIGFSATNVIMTVREQAFASYATQKASMRGVLILVGR